MLKVVNLFVFIYTFSLTHCENPCGDWTPYEDEKCFKLVTRLQNYQDALSTCRQYDIDSILAVIKTNKEQELIVKILKDQRIADNVWIGIKKINDKYKNLDETDLEVTYWAKGRPLVNKTGLDCVEISTDEQTYGQWMDEKCQKQNAILCQKIQPWSISRLQSILLDTRRTLSKQIETMIQNPVPIGFIYVQLFNQSEPHSLWPNTEWHDITSKYAGLFFRAQGGQSSAFGQIQEQQTESIEIQSYHYINNAPGPFNISNTYQSNPIFTGKDGNGQPVVINLKFNEEEIRPRNTAIRVWQRTK